jgi:hypothetical protein
MGGCAGIAEVLVGVHAHHVEVWSSDQTAQHVLADVAGGELDHSARHEAPPLDMEPALTADR